MTAKIDPHTHSLLSGHAYNTMREMAESAAEKGMEILGVTEHGPGMDPICSWQYFVNFGVVDRYKYGVRLLLGIEADITGVDGGFDVDEDIIKNLEIVIASFHFQCYTSGSVKDNTKALISAISKPFVTIAGHPDDGKFPVDYKEVVKAAIDSHTLIEVNNGSLKEPSFRLNGRENCSRMLEECAKQGAYVVMSSDAHSDSEVGEMDCSLALLEEMQFPRELIVNYDKQLFLSYLNDVGQWKMGGISDA